MEPLVTDETTFEAVYRASYARLVGQLVIVTTSRAEAEEAVQEAFARLWARWSTVRGYDNCEAWVRRVALNVAIGRHRKFLRQTVFTESASSQGDPASSDLSILLALARLPRNQRAALLLHYVVGLSVEEIATEMSTKLGTVKSWLSRGKAELDSSLREEGGQEQSD
jgi:RNA polymerase sigma-70 factor (ECF subfamily)